MPRDKKKRPVDEDSPHRRREEFTNEFIEALNHRTTTEFQNKYRKVDVLLMDDVQFIASKERTQEEFFSILLTP